MKNIKIDDLVYEIPESWTDVNIDLFQDYTRHNIKYATDIVEEFELLDRLRLISVITRIPIDKLELIDIKYVKDIVDSISFLNTPVKKQLVTKITIDDIDLKLRDMSKLKFKDVINIEVLISENNPVLVLDKIVGILYDSEEIKDMDFEVKCQKIREQVSIDKIFNISNFFLVVCEIYDYHIQTSKTIMKLRSQKKWMKLMIVKMKYLYRNTTTHWLINYQAIKSYLSIKYLN